MLRILNRYYPIRNFFFFFGEGLIIFISLLAAAYTRFGGDIGTLANYSHLIPKALLVTIVCQLCLYYNDLYDFKVVTTNIELIIRLLQAIGTSYLLLAFIYFLFPAAILGRGVFLINLFFLTLLIVSWRLLYNWVLKSRRFDQKLLVVGTGDLARKLTEEINNRKDSGFQIMGFIGTNPLPVERKGACFPILGSHGQIFEIVKKYEVEKIVVAIQERRGNFPADELLRCRVGGVEIEEAISFFEKLAGKVFVQGIYPSWLIFSGGFKKSRLKKTIKRVSGMILSSIGLTLSLPLLLITAISIKVESRGPMIYKQERIGENGKIFRLLKFRSMIQDAEPKGKALWATAGDSRITKLGRVIRKFRIDEIPQMINVLKGDMNFVGPRPERPQFVEELEKQIPYYSQRCSIKPGITGWAQIMYPYGSSVEDALEKLHYDLYYIKNMSIIFDLIIVFNTIKVILFGKGAR